MSQEHEGFIHRLFGQHEHAASRQSALDLDDIQGLILRGYRMPIVRHFLLRVRAPARWRAGDEDTTFVLHSRCIRGVDVADAVTPSLTGGDVLFSLIAYITVYAVIYSSGFYYIYRVLRDGPAVEVRGALPGPARATALRGAGECARFLFADRG